MLITQPHGAAVPGPHTATPRDLFDALRLVTRDLSLADMHRRIVIAACDLVGADDGALAIRGCDGDIVHVVAHGAGAALVDDVSAGQRPQVIVAVEVRGTCYATLHVAAAGETGTADHAALLQRFVAAAGDAIDNARHHDEARRSRDWLNASGEIARALLADADADTLLDVVSRALHVAEADLGSLVLPTDDGRLRVAISVGVGAAQWRDRIFEPGHSDIGRAMARGESLLVPDIEPLAADDFDNIHHYGPMMVAPLIDAKGIRGAVVLVRVAGRTGFTPHELDLATTFADQVALALELNDMRADTEALRALQERHRIAQDLHDNVMQRLFATGMRLQGLVAKSGLPDDAVGTLQRHVADLDETIDEIRDTVFGLRTGEPSDVVRTQARFPRVPVEYRPGGETGRG